jgi:putative membrane protein
MGLTLGIIVTAQLPAAGVKLDFGLDIIGTLWLNGLRMTVVPLVVALVVTGIVKSAEAARAGLFEVQAAELARSQATSPAVKDFAERIITDHGKANQELKRLAQKKDATLPTTLSSKEERGLDHLRKASVRDFDKVYAQHMVEEHQHDLNKFRRAAEHADDPDLKSFAQGASVVIEDHLLAAKDLQEFIRLESGARSGD